MKNLPKIVVLMAAYNRADLIRTAIDSFLKQTYPNTELLICDDCSTDDTWDIIRAYAEQNASIKIFRNEKNIGFIRTINWLFTVAEGDFISILDSDDWVAAHKLEHQLKLLEQYDADCIISEFISVKTNGTQIPVKPKYDKPKFLSVTDPNLYFPSGSFFTKSEVIKTIGGYHDYFADTFCGDIYFIHLVAEKYKILYDPEHLYYYRLAEGSMTQSFDLEKLVKLEIVYELIKERMLTGSDKLERGEYGLLEKRAKEILKGKKWRSRQYRIYGARYIDENKFNEARKFIKEAIVLNPLSFLNYRTLIYFFKKRLVRTSDRSG